MLERLEQQPPDALLALIKLHDADPRGDKIDLGVGVYRTGQGETPVFGAIKAAEQKLVTEQGSKAYLGPEGDMGFVHALMPYVFGGDDPTRGGRIEGMQTPGGTGAVRLALALARKAGVTRVLMGVPSWPNHAQIVADLEMELVSFNHATADGSAAFAALIAAVPEALIAYSCDKNFGLYRDRVGALYIYAQDGEQLARALSNGHALARAAWSMPPDHGAAAVRLVLSDPALTARWLDELD